VWPLATTQLLILTASNLSQLRIATTPKTRARYQLAFADAALVEWQKLDGSIKEPLRKILKKRLDAPHAVGNELHGELANCYKIKLRAQGYRLVYQVIDQMLIVMVISIGKRDKNAVYENAIARLEKSKK
jgi:mRNA interferase RelE/StbE